MKKKNRVYFSAIVKLQKDLMKATLSVVTDQFLAVFCCLDFPRLFQ